MPSTKPTASKCNACYKVGTPNSPLKACSGCHAAKYCSKECQTAHWKNHKEACKKNAAHAASLQNELNPAHMIPLPDGMTLTELDQRLEKWIKFHTGTLLAATIHGLELPRDITRTRTHVLHIYVMPRTDHGGKSGKFFRVIDATVHSIEEAKGFREPWRESLEDAGRMRDESERLRRGTIALAGVTCPPLGVQMVPFGSLRKMSEIRVLPIWKDILKRDVEDGKKFDRWDNL